MEGIYLMGAVFFVALFLGCVLTKKLSPLQEKHKEEEDFSHAVIHELRAYLTNLNWVFEKLVDKGLANYTDEQYKAISLGKHTVENANNLVNDTLNAISIGRTESRFKFKLNDIDKLLEQIMEEYVFIAQERDVKLKYIKAERPIPLFFFDNSQMYLAIHDIVHNAIKYTKNGGSVTIRADFWDGKAKISISDTGIGIPESEQAKIFTKYFRATNAKKVVDKGSGLGMFIAKNIITRHGGEISLKSKENEGTTIEIILPLPQAEPKENAQN